MIEDTLETRMICLGILIVDIVVVFGSLIIRSLLNGNLTTEEIVPIILTTLLVLSPFISLFRRVQNYFSEAHKFVFIALTLLLTISIYFYIDSLFINFIHDGQAGLIFLIVPVLQGLALLIGYSYMKRF